MTAQEFKTTLKGIHKQIDIVGYKTEAAKQLFTDEYNLKVNFKNEHGEQALLEALLPKKSLNHKTHQSKGHFYNNA